MEERRIDTPAVVLIGSDAAVRRVMRLGLELDGAIVVEGSSIDEARDRATTAGHEVRGVVVDVGISSDEVRRSWPRARVVALEEHADGIDPDTLRRRLDLRMPQSRAPVLVAARLVWEEAESLAASWAELCRWDPMLPPDNAPPIAVYVVRAVGDALSRPQPLGWGVDPAVEDAIERFTAQSVGLEIAVGQLVCLREALRRRIGQVVPAGEREETLNRLSMVVDRAIACAAALSARALEYEAMIDPLTGLLNRRALERDLRREFGRAARYDTSVSLMVVDVDHLKVVNDTEGHLAGDHVLVALARAFGRVLRAVDAAYRVGGDEFVVMLPDAGADTADLVAARASASGAPPFSWGVATYPVDGESVDRLLGLADARLFERRRVARSVS